MFIKFTHTLVANLVTGGALTFPSDFDEYRLAPNGHVIMVDDSRYASPADFTITSDGSGDLTLHWLHADTIVTGKILRVGVAYIDLMIGGLLGTGGGGGTSDATAANQTVVQATPGSDATKAIAIQGVTGGKSIPVTGPLTDAQLRASAVPVSGVFWQTTQPVSGTFWQATQPVSGPLTDTQLRAAAVPVSGAFWQATQPVSGPLTDGQLRAAAVPVSGPLTDAQLRASAFPVTTGGLTDAQLRATAVPISGTVTASGPLTDTQLRATPVPVSGTFNATTTVKATAAPPAYGEGSTTNPLSTDLSGQLRVVGSFSASSVVKASAADPVYAEGSTLNPVSVDLNGYQRVLAKQSATWVVSGPLTDAQLRAGPLQVTGVFWQTTQPVSGTFWQATQPVSGPLTDAQLRATAVPVSGTVAVTGPLTDAQLRATPVPVSGTFNATTTVKATAAAPAYGEGSTTNPLSTDLSGQLRVVGAFTASSVVKATAADPTYVEGTTANPVSVDLAGYQRVLAKQSGSYAVTGPVTDAQLRASAVPVSGTFFPGTQPVSGTFWQATQPVSGPLTDTQLRATAVPVSGTVTATGPLTDAQLRGSAVPVSGPLTDAQLRATAVPVSNSSLPLPTGAATSALQGVQGTGATFNPPTGGSGEIGHLSGIYAETKANGTKLDTLHADIISPTPSAVYGVANFVSINFTTDTIAYANNDLLADTQAVAGAVRANDALGLLQSMVITDEAAQGVAFDIYVFSANVSMGTENSPVSLTDANSRELLGVVSVAATDWKDQVNNKMAFKPNCGMVVKPATGTDTVYVAIVLRSGAPVFNALSIWIRFGFLS